MGGTPWGCTQIVPAFLIALPAMGDHGRAS